MSAELGLGVAFARAPGHESSLVGAVCSPLCPASPPASVQGCVACVAGDTSWHLRREGSELDFCIAVNRVSATVRLALQYWGVLGLRLLICRRFWELSLETAISLSQLRSTTGWIQHC